VRCGAAISCGSPQAGPVLGLCGLGSIRICRPSAIHDRQCKPASTPWVRARSGHAADASPLVTHAQARRTRRHPWSHPAPGTGRGNRQTRPFQEPLHASQFLLCFEGLVGTGPPVVIYSPTLAVRALGSCSGHARRRGSPHSPCSRSSAVGACRRWHPRRSCRRRPGSRRDPCS